MKTWIIVGLIALIGLGVEIWNGNAISKLEECADRFEDEMEITQSTSRIDLPVAIRELNEIRREAENISAPPWVSSREKAALLSAMNSFIRATRAFQNSDNDAQDLQAIEMLLEAQDKFDAYRAL